MARQWAKFEGNVKRLITNITGFEDYEENFGLCLQFAQSNILHHQFLSVDSHRARRTLKGLEEKFAVHSDEKKAKAFRDYTEAFLEIPAFEDRDNGKTDTHYAILSLLVNLADAPTHAKYKTPKPSKHQEEEDDFDWRGYLLDGEDVFSGPYPPTPEWSEDEDEDDDVLAVSRPPPRLPRSAWGVPPLPQSGLLAPIPALSTDAPCEAEDDWLMRNVVAQYWDIRAVPQIDLTHSRETTLSADWDDFLLSQNQLYIPTENVSLTEYQVLREVLWMVAGGKKTFIFEVKDGRYSVRPGIQVAHLTKEALYNFLSEATQYGNILLRLSLFIEEVTSSLCYYDNQGRPDMRTCQTYQAFVSVLSKVIQEFRDQLMVLERDIVLQEKPTTLMHIMEQLRRWFPQLHLLNTVYEEGVLAMRDKTNVERASHLLSVLYETLIDLDTLGQDVSTVILFLRLWSATSRPYWDIVDRWISQGELSDPYKEFLIQRNDNVKSLDEDFWNSAFTLYTPNTAENSKNAKLSTQQATNMGKSGSRQSRSHHTDTTDTTTVEEALLAPEFLQPVIRQIILAGKSMEMLQALGRLADIVDDHQTKDGVRDTLYESFIKSLQKHIGTTSEQIHNSKKGDSMSDSVSKSPSHLNVQPQMQGHIDIKGSYDPLLRHNFSAIFDSEVFHYKPLTDKEKFLEEQLSTLDVGHVMPIRLLLEKCLYPDIIERYQLVCRHLLDILKSDYHLLDYFTAMRAFFLMEAGDSMYDFYTELFDKKMSVDTKKNIKLIEHLPGSVKINCCSSKGDRHLSLRLQESWQDMSFLNMSLHEALTSQFPEHTDRLYVSVADVRDPADTTYRHRDRQPINALDDLKMHYKTPWPINVVLNTHNFKVYNSVFSFLLQIKRSKYCLDQLRFDDLQRPRDEENLAADQFSVHSAQQVATRTDRIHRMHLFRMKLMHFLNSLHNYIMTRILHSTGLEFQEALACAQDLDDVIRLHATYVGHLHERCLLHHMVRFLKVAVTKVMNLALALQVCWDTGVDSVSEKHLAGMETEFSRCIVFLGSFLNNVVKKGSHPHLESLAYALLTSSERGKIEDTK